MGIDSGPSAAETGANIGQRHKIANTREIKVAPLSPTPPKEDSPVKDQESKPNFALDKWEYGKKESVTAFVDTISQRDPAVKAELEAAFNEGGGKAFGLKVCEMVTRNFSDPESGSTLTVPEWKILSNIANVDPANYEGKILRSSTDDEDWIDPKSGVHSSYKLPKDSSMLAKDKEKGTLFEGHYIEQPLQEGFGLVVDVGYSRLLGRPVVKISSGNIRGDHSQQFTSAVSDTEAAVGVWDSKGETVLPTRNYNHDSLFGDNQNFTNIFAGKLYDALSKTGIDFGVQMEMVVNPNNPKDFHLIQLRPSPENMTKTIKSESDESARKKELGIEGQRPKLTLKSASVNGRFNIISDSSVIRDVPYVRGLSGITTSFWDGKMSPDLLEKFDSRREKRGEITLYDRRDRTSKNYETEGLLGSYLSGADVLITPTPIKPNNNHGAMANMDRAYGLLDNCGMVSVTDQQHQQLESILTGGKQSSELKDNVKTGKIMQVASDGLIAEISVWKGQKKNLKA